MAGAEDTPTSRRQNEPRRSADRLLDEMLRQIGGEILGEPVPEELRRVLRPKDGSDVETTAIGSRDHPTDRDAPTQRRDDEPSG